MGTKEPDTLITTNKLLHWGHLGRPEIARVNMEYELGGDVWQSPFALSPLVLVEQDAGYALAKSGPAFASVSGRTGRIESKRSGWMLRLKTLFRG